MSSHFCCCCWWRMDLQRAGLRWWGGGGVDKPLCHRTSQIKWITEQMFTVTLDRHGRHVHMERAWRFITAPHVQALARGQRPSASPLLTSAWLWHPRTSDFSTGRRRRVTKAFVRQRLWKVNEFNPFVSVLVKNKAFRKWKVILYQTDLQRRRLKK